MRTPTTKKTRVLALLLGAEFSEVIRNYLTPTEIGEAIRRNRIAHPNVCHTHDFCDANMAMERAFHNLHLGTPFDCTNEYDEAATALWSAAWDIAKEAEFCAEVILDRIAIRP